MSANTGPPSVAPSNALCDVVNGKASMLDQAPETIVPGDILYEVVNGQIVELPSMGAFEVDIGSMLHLALGYHGKKENLGRAEAEMLFVLDPVKNQKRRPDVAFVSYERWPRKRRVPRAEA